MQDELVYPRERTLGTITLVLGILVWLLIVVGTVGIALVYLLIGFGPLEAIVQALFVGPQMRATFAYRQRVLPGLLQGTSSAGVTSRV